MKACTAATHRRARPAARCLLEGLGGARPLLALAWSCPLFQRRWARMGPGAPASAGVAGMGRPRPCVRSRSRARERRTASGSTAARVARRRPRRWRKCGTGAAPVRASRRPCARSARRAGPACSAAAPHPPRSRHCLGPRGVAQAFMQHREVVGREETAPAAHRCPAARGARRFRPPAASSTRSSAAARRRAVGSCRAQSRNRSPSVK